jgi:hypothetical protein
VLFILFFILFIFLILTSPVPFVSFNSIDDSVCFIPFSLSPADRKTKLCAFYSLLPNYFENYVYFPGDKFVYEVYFGGEF